MSGYVLVSLWAKDDEASAAAHAMAMRAHEIQPALALIAGEAPDRGEIRRALEAAPGASLVIFGHGGAHFAARRGGASWACAAELAALAPGRRVYAFACDTFTPTPKLLWQTFGDEAVRACVGVFVGHAAPVMSPFAYEGSRRDARERMERGVLALIAAFVAGVDDEDVLRNLGATEAVDDDSVIELDLPSADPDQEGAFGWSSGLFLHAFRASLRTRAKPLA
ncbi:MAG: hypothetical protein ABIO70_15380 [Pseudomonadota bacterium]